MTRFFKYSSSSYSTLIHNPKHRFAQNHALNIYNSDAIYSFIPKNACSTLRTSLAKANGCIKDTSDFNWIHSNNNTFNASLSELAKAKYTFTVLRCPYARLASVYLDKIVSRDRVAWNLIDLTKRKVAIEELSFSKFISILKSPHVKFGNIHWRPQVDFLVYEKYDDYFSLENFDDAINKLKNKIGLELIDARPLTKHGIDSLDQNDHENHSDTLPHEILTMKTYGFVPSPLSLYNEEIIKSVTDMFHDDIELFKEKFGSNNLLINRT